jgi:multiple sugar transport system substrate-binding protein
MQRRIFNYLLILSLSLCLASGLFATGKQEAAKGPITVTFWNGFTAADGDALREIVKEWNAENPNIQIEMSVIVWTTFYDKLTASAAAGRGPDIAALHYERLVEYASRGVLLPLDEYTASAGLRDDDFVQIPWKGGIYQGKRCAVALDWMPLIGLYYNKGHYREAGLDPESPPKDGRTFVEYSKKLTTGDRWGYMVSRSTPLARLFLSIIYQNESTLISKDMKKSLINAPEAVDAVQIIADTIHKYKIAPLETAPNEENAAMKAGKLSHVLHHLAMSNDFGAQKDLDLGYAAIPVFGKSQAVFPNSHQIVLPKPKEQDPKKISAAMEFIKWLLMEKGMDWAKAGQLAIRKQILESAEFMALPFHANQVAMQPYLRYPPQTTKWGEVYARIHPNVEKVILGIESAQSAMNNAAKEQDAILSK